MIFLHFIILGLVQGLTEFLPVSSSGHLFLIGKYFQIEESLFVSVVLHVATLLSICVVMRKELWTLLKNPFSKEVKNLVVSSVATFIIVILLYKVIKILDFYSYLPFFFMLTACLLFLTQIFSKKKGEQKINIKQSFVMGVAQGLAVFPGLSRSGATICAGVLSGAKKEEVAKHSFLMSIPIILASLVMELYELRGISLVSVPILPILTGFIVAFVVGFLSLKFMMRLACKLKFSCFSYYLIFISIISLMF